MSIINILSESEKRGIWEAMKILSEGDDCELKVEIENLKSKYSPSQIELLEKEIQIIIHDLTFQNNSENVDEENEEES